MSQIISHALALLEQSAPQAQELPARIEALNLAAFDVAAAITDYTDQAARIEEAATAEASSESNADKRKARRAELLRDDSEYEALNRQVRSSERVRVQLQERAHRHARELRIFIAERGGVQL